MTQEELQKKVIAITAERRPEGMYIDWEIVNQVLQLINQHVESVIGEDNSVERYMGNQGMENNPYDKARNELRAEQRKKAGL